MHDRRNEAYMGNSLIKKAGVTHNFTPDQLLELKKCAEDVVYFTENYCKIITVDQGMQLFKVFDYQKKMLNSFTDHRFNICLLPRQMGKCVHGDTMIEVRHRPSDAATRMSVSNFHDHFTQPILPLDPKFIESFEVSEWEVMTDTGWEEITHSHKTIPYQIYTVVTCRGKHLSCADDHILFRADYTEIFVRDLVIGDEVRTTDGVEVIKDILIGYTFENMYDLSVNSDNHRYYTNGFLSHNSTVVAAFILHYALFNPEKTAAVLANKAVTSREILSRIQRMYENLPWWLQMGVKEWNKGSALFGNDSKILSAATSSSSIRGQSINCVVGSTPVTVRSRDGQVVNLPIKEVYPDLYDEILTQDGFKKFDGIRSSYNTEFKLRINDRITVTPGHQFRTAEGIFKRAACLNIGEMLANGIRVDAIQTVFSEEFVYDPVNVKDTASYVTGDFISHNCLYLDEFAHIEQQMEFWESTYPVISSGDSTKVIITSTPKGLELFHKIYKEAEEGKNSFVPIRVEWWEHPKRDEKWKEETLKNIGYEQFKQEFMNEFQGSSGTLISGEKLRVLSESNPIHSAEGIYQYKSPIKGRSYVLIADVGEGKGLDYSAFAVIDVTEMPYQQVCTFRDNLVGPIDYAAIVYRIAKLYNEAQVMIEINSIGVQVSDTMWMDYGYENMVSTVSAGRNGKKISSGFGKNVDRGIRTTRGVKATGCSILKLLIEQDQLILHDKFTIDELKKFARKGNSFEAEKGAHDDMVMPLVLFAWMTEQSYFKEMTDIETLRSLRERSDEELDDSLSFFFVDNGIDDPFGRDEEVVETWMGW
ncbi:MAG: terminase family protein [Anaerolineaceae bacterium]